MTEIKKWEDRVTTAADLWECITAREAEIAELRAALAKSQPVEHVPETDFGNTEPVAKVVSSGPADFPILQWISAELSLSTKTGDLLYLHPVRPMSQAEAEALAHRRASKYAHRSEPEYIAYTFLPHTLMDFVRDVEAHIKGATE